MEKNETKVLSVRLDKSIEDEAHALNIDIKSVIEEALKEKIARARTKRLSKILKGAIIGAGISKKEWVNAVKETRDER